METAFCIYSKKDGTNASFKTGEHIIPKCIGGTECLPLGWVSDEVNNKFSALELEFARNNPLIDIPRSFEDSNIGRKKHKNRHKIDVMSGNNTLALGYIEQGKPIYLDTIILTYTEKRTFNVTLNLKKDDFIEDENEKILSRLKINVNSIKEERSNKLNNSCLLAYSDSWYLFYPENFSDSDLKKLKHFIEKFKQSEFKFISSEVKKDDMINVSQHYEIDCYKVYRVYAKIAFNALAKIKGRAFVLDERFDKIRTAIVNGDNINNLVELISINLLKNLCCQYDVLKTIIDNENLHSIFYLVKDKNLYGFISCFGSNCHKILLAENIANKDMPFEGFICDYKNKKEVLLSEILKI